MLEVDVDVLRDEKVHAAIAVVIQKRTTCFPLNIIAPQPGRFRDIREGAIAVVVQQHTMPPKGDEQIRASIIVVIARADSLSPSRQRRSSLARHIGESSIVIVVVKMAGWLDSLREALQRGSVYKKNVRPAIVVIVKEGRSAARSFHDVFFCFFAAVFGLGMQPCSASDVHKIYARWHGSRPFYGFRSILGRDRRNWEGARLENQAEQQQSSCD